MKSKISKWNGAAAGDRNERDHFGAFVDIGVHQDGLVHISHLSDKFVKDPNAVIAVQQKVKVTVMEVDAPRKRIALSMKSDPFGGGAVKTKEGDKGAAKNNVLLVKKGEVKNTSKGSAPSKEESMEDKLAMLRRSLRSKCWVLSAGCWVTTHVMRVAQEVNTNS